jgi:predicted CxxxxCH...CXXCH cytochrome family protein
VDGSTITSISNHVNRSYTLAAGPTVSFSYTFATSGGTCNNISCHSNGTSVATGVLVSNTMVWGTGPFYCGSCHNYPPDYPTGSPKANSHTIKEHAQYSCSKCHYTTTTDGATITNPANHANGIYDVVPNPPTLFTYTFATNGGTCSTVGCHNDAGNRQWGAVLDCNYCHDSPPQTPAHLKHFSGLPSLAAYGDTHVTEDYGTTNSTGYIFNCGNCHPRAPEFHRNGKIDVEFFDPLAPDGLKKLHPVTATYVKGSQLFIDSRGYRYTKGTCSNVYCHSTHTWTTEQDAQGNVVKTNTVPVYRTVTWEGTIAKNCTACHANPPATDVATNKNGSGNSHMWLTPLGWQEGHNNKTWFNIEPIACSYCHNNTVQVKNTWTRQHDGGWPTFTFYSAVPIANYAKHVNGRVDVAFDKVRPFVVQGYDDNNQPSGNVLAYKYFSSARYVPQTKTCANVSCHKAQTSVRWGDPYYYWKVYVNEPGPQPTCYTCHVQGELPPGVP